MATFNNKTVLITGGTAGIGRAAAEDFIAKGAKVIITGRHRDTLDGAVKQLGPNAHGIVSDNSSMADIMQLREKVIAITPTIDVVFANAGYGKFAPAEMVIEAMFDELFDTLVKGTYFTIQQLLPVMNQGGSIIMNASVVTKYGSENASIYAAAKLQGCEKIILELIRLII